MESLLMGKFEDQMCQSAANALLLSLDSLQSEHFKTTTLSDGLISLMSKLNLSEQRCLIKRAHNYLAININPAALEKQIKEIKKQREDYELEDTYLFHGAPLVLMRRLFGMHASEFSRRRSILNIGGAGSGRPPLCDEKTDHLVWKSWLTHQNTDERDRFLKVAQDTDLDLHLIWGALREHIDA